MRLVLLLTSMTAFGVLWIWVYAPERVHRVDEALRTYHITQHSLPFDEAVELLQTEDPSAGIPALQRVLNDLSEVAKGERLAPLKRKAFSLLATTYTENGQSAEAMQVYDQWLAFDDRDITAQLSRANLLGSDGFPILEDLLRRFPRSRAVVAAHQLARGPSSKSDADRAPLR